MRDIKHYLKAFSLSLSLVRGNFHHFYWRKPQEFGVPRAYSALIYLDPEN